MVSKRKSWVIVDAPIYWESSCLRYISLGRLKQELLRVYNNVDSDVVPAVVRGRGEFAADEEIGRLVRYRSRQPVALYSVRSDA